MKELITDKDELRNLLAKNLIADNYKISGSEVLNPQIYKNAEASISFLLMENDEIIGGMNVIFDYYNWAHIYMTWVSELYRTKGLGTKIMDMVKKFAMKKGCTGIKTETWEFQAKGFYEKNGFKVYGVLDDHPKGIKEYYLYYKFAY